MLVLSFAIERCGRSEDRRQKEEASLFVSVSKVTNFPQKNSPSRARQSARKRSSTKTVGPGSIQNDRNDDPRAITGQIDGRRVPTKIFAAAARWERDDDDDDDAERTQGVTSKRGENAEQKSRV